MQGIPNDLNREQVLQAIEDLKAGKASRWASSKKYLLVHEGEAFAPKAVLGLAICAAKGVDQWFVDFSGGEPTNRALRTLGFEIIEKGSEPR